MEILQKKITNIDVNDTFFDSLRENYSSFNKWFKTKKNEKCYYVKENGSIVAFLYLKIENESENYSDITPVFLPKKRIKIGTFKVSKKNCGIGREFINIILNFAKENKIDNIYFTIYNNSKEIKDSIPFFEKYGFKYYGKKGKEEVYERNLINLIKVISIKEPWASLVKERVKHIETRSWATKYRGELYIHTSKRKLTNKDLIAYKEPLSLLSDTNFQYGHIVAKCKLVDCKIMTEEFIKEIKKNHKEYICGEYSVNRYAWILEDIEVLDKPIEANGQLGIWSYSEIKK